MPGSVNAPLEATPGTPPVLVRLDGVGRRFGETVAVDGVSLEVAAGEFLTLLGPSGCGKTTTLRMIAGFEQPTSGRILIGGRDVTGLPPQKRDVGMVFQNYALFPHLDVWENVAFGLKSRGERGAGVEAAVTRALGLVELEPYARRKVQALSGGQQQRVALARALAPEPPVLLLDEPLSNLDAALRERTRDELRALLKRLGMTAVFVTHDQEEAFALSDRIAVMERGRLQQVGSPEALYAAPVNAFVASFLGRANFLAARVDSVDGDRATCAVAPGVVWRARLAADTPRGAGDAVRLMARPEALTLADVDEPNALGARVLDRRFAGAATFYRVETEAGPELLVQGGPHAARPGERVGICLDESGHTVAFAAEP
ncbi:ATP-binding cassette domain-containing protein [Longimicrobium terrae]|uniref:ABC-type Fe3+/spermidine/putrescine transport system ATPase subunit n=1 Tax=Longimicrobium terrae TaxID=1639882 RepID=A0A841H135_9BACT|nr:ABC-type Fe3+/spermidine/putrescine transport system ATPase subunit [Longimicrobium terrae]MBB6071674.1 ABC-type Fe3+/spermidine/putrescine transport system ATPase subunit [Longimicrobium terrae]NNC28435.1 ABC transporter ATP-binding protein [Longimicrobium terrae]